MTNSTDQQQQAGVCPLCSEHDHDELFECLHCNFRYHAKCLDSIGDVNFSADGSWTCIICDPSDAVESQPTNQTLKVLTRLEGQVTVQLASIRKAKAQLLEDLRQGAQPVPEQINLLKRELSATRAELQDSRKRIKEMEDAMKVEPSATAELQENGDLHA